MIKIDDRKINSIYISKLIAKNINEMTLEEKIYAAYGVFKIISKIDDYATFLLFDIIKNISEYTEETDKSASVEFFEKLQFLDEKNINLILKIIYSFWDILMI